MPKNLCPPEISYAYDNCHLATRGWVFQETLVSTTSLYLTHQGLAWDCCTEQSREGGGDPQPAVDKWPYPSGTLTNKASWARHNRKWLADRSGSSACDNPNPPVDELRIFHQWVSYASRRNLSKTTDKLPSLAGIASRLSKATGSSYVAGLFQRRSRHRLEVARWSERSTHHMPRQGSHLELGFSRWANQLPMVSLSRR